MSGPSSPFLKVVRPLNAVDVHRVPTARVGESTRMGVSSPLVRGGGGGLGTSPMKIL